MNSALGLDLDPAAVPKVPTQARAKLRFETVLQEAEKMLLDDGIRLFSIPLLAQRLNMTRGSVYVYFPTHYAILNELAHRYLAELEVIYTGQAQALATLPWKQGVQVVVEQAVRFYNQRPVARLLILGGAVADSSFRAQEALLRRLGGMGRAVWEHQSGQKMPDTPDIFTLAVEMAVACFRRSVFEHGDITPAHAELAGMAMIQFLQPFLDDKGVLVPVDKPKAKLVRNAARKLG